MRRAALVAVLFLAATACANDAEVGDSLPRETTQQPAEPPAEQPPTDRASTVPSEPVTPDQTADEPDGEPDRGPDGEPDRATDPAPDAPPAPDDAGAPGAAAVPDLDGIAVGLEPIGTFDLPVDLVDHDGALWVVEQRGRVVRLDDDGTTTTVADIGERISGANEQGLLGLAFDDGTAYLNYTVEDGTTVVSAVPVDADGDLDLAAERVVIEIEQPFANHNAGDLLFDADGRLVIPLGDGGSGGDPLLHGPDPATLLGTIVRIDPRPSGDASYGIPDDNPFAASGEGRPEVWAWGLRNPWRVDLDPATGDLWIADVGQNLREEINLVRADGTALPGRAAFYGWSAREGDLVFDESIDAADAVPPVHTYGRDDGCSVSGGAVYRGERIDGLAGAYVYGDYCSGRLWAFDPLTGDNVLLRDDLVGLTTVRRGNDGELYAVQHGGDVWRLTPPR